MNVRPTAFPLNHDQQGAQGQTTVKQLSERYKNMLGSQAASFDIGLFYQLERSAEDAVSMEKVGNSSDVSRYGMGTGPVEAGGTYA